MKFSPRNLATNFWKLLLTLGGGATGAGVAQAVKVLWDVDLDPVLAGGVATVVAGLCTGFGPRNTNLPVRVLTEKTTAEPTPTERRAMHSDDDILDER